MTVSAQGALLPLSPSGTAPSVNFARAGKGADAAKALFDEGVKELRSHRAFKHPVFAEACRLSNQAGGLWGFDAFRQCMIAHIHLTNADDSAVRLAHGFNLVADALGLRTMYMEDCYNNLREDSVAFKRFSETVLSLRTSHRPALDLAAATASSDIATSGLMAQAWRVCETFKPQIHKSPGILDLAQNCFNRHVSFDHRGKVQDRADVDYQPLPIDREHNRRVQEFGRQLSSVAQAETALQVMQSYADAQARFFDDVQSLLTHEPAPASSPAP